MATPTRPHITNVFVYGSLCSGQPQAHRLTPWAAAPDPRPATVYGYHLHHADDLDYPHITPSPGGDRSTVHGELVPLNPATLTDALAALDAYEGVIAGMPNASEYTRTPVTAYTNDGRNHQAWIWIASHTTIRDLNLGPATLIRSGRWAAAPQKETL